MLTVGAPTVSASDAPPLNGPVPGLLSVADSTRLNVPTAVGVPDTVAVVAVVAVTDRPAARYYTRKPLKGAAPPPQV